MIKIKNICIITDFDHTITSKESKSTWDVLELSEKIPKKYQKQFQKNKNYYLPKEKDYKISFKKKSYYMKKWSEKNLKIFTKCQITKEDIIKMSNENCMTFRKEAKNLFKFANTNDIPIIIVSAGIKDVIENFLSRNNLLTKNVHIISNKLKYRENKLIGLENKLIHLLNKSKVKLPKNLKKIIKTKRKIYLLGDNIEDALLIPKGKEKVTTKIGFLENENIKEYKKVFDKVLKNGTFKEVLSIIKENP